MIKELITDKNLEKMFIVIGQVTSSISSFLFSFYILRYLNVGFFADYTIIMSLCLLFASLQNALITTPLMIEKGRFDDFVVNGFFRHCIMITFVKIIPSFTVLYLLSVDGALLISVFYVTSYLLKEFSKTVIIWYSEVKFLAIFEFVNFILNSALISTFVIFELHSLKLLMLFVSIFSLLMSAYVFIKYKLARMYGSEFSYSSNWSEISWSLRGVLVTEINSRGYVYLLSIFLGKESVALINAPRILFNPLNAIGYAFVKYCKPKVAHLHNSSETSHGKKMLDNFKNATYIISLSVSFFCYLFWDNIYNFLFFNFNDVEIKIVAVSWLVVMLFQIHNSFGSSYLQICRCFKELFYVSLLSAVNFCLISLILFYCGVGDLFYVAIPITGEIVIAIVLAFYTKKVFLKKENSNA